MTDQPDQPQPDQGQEPWSPAEVLDHRSAESARGRRRRWPIVAGAAAVLTVAGAGLALAMALSGGGTQPEEVIPEGALFYADVDLDPGAEQKVNLLRLLSTFPDVRTELGDRSDVKTYLVKQLLQDSDTLGPDEVTPWLGDRAGVAVLWDDDAGAPVVVVALQVTDEQRAAQALSDYDDGEVAFDRGYVIITPGVLGFAPVGAINAVDVMSQSATASLADDAQFQQSMDPLGTGLASMYVDGDALAEILNHELGGLEFLNPTPMGLPTQALSGRIAAVLRAEPSALEVVGSVTSSTTGPARPPTQLMATLPSSTTAALALSGGGDAVGAQWQELTRRLEKVAGIPGLAAGQPVSLDSLRTDRDVLSQFDRSIAMLQKQYNIRLPDDLITLFGEDMVVAVDGEGLFGGTPSVGMRSVTDPAAAADLADRLQPVIDDLTAGFGVSIRAVDDGLVIATSSTYADQLAREEGGLVDGPQVLAALPDLGQASTLLWVDLESVSGFVGLVDPDSVALLDPLEGLGVASGSQDGGSFFRARLTFTDN